MESIPDFLIEKLNNQYGQDVTKRILEGYKVNRYTTFRVNTLKVSTEEIEEVLKKENIDFEKVTWSREAYIIKNKNEQDIQNLKIFEEGKIYLQSLSSMLPPIMLNPKENVDILDMCAAPGGKTCELACLTNNNSNITACELNKIRLEKLKYNIEKQGATSVYIMNVDSRKLNDFFSFDNVLLDAPCSGSGTISIFNKNLEKIFTKELVEKSVKSQLELIKKAVNVLKVNEEMIYSTCSILEEENENIINTILKQGKCKIVPIDMSKYDLPYLKTKIDGTVCIMPNEYFEGFFVAKIRRERN